MVNIDKSYEVLNEKYRGRKPKLVLEKMEKNIYLNMVLLIMKCMQN